MADTPFDHYSHGMKYKRRSEDQKLLAAARPAAAGLIQNKTDFKPAAEAHLLAKTDRETQAQQPNGTMKDTTNKLGSQEASLKHLGLENLGHVHWNLSTPALYEEAIRRYEGAMSHLGPFVIRTGQYTGRLPKDKFLVREPSSENKISWGKINRPLDAEKFEALKYRLCAYLQGKDIYIENCFAGADEHYRLTITSLRASIAPSHSAVAASSARRLPPNRSISHEASKPA
jgi:hypothetical protein